ncbi:DUF2804 domain-containing protein [Thalassotalea sp. ND16A]|uniref:DUF2804 domain-containing protein n=1 Tax=Thalassotalea sp. ND16A TaxID=1535422 RepID=UPI00051A76A4|nr:DUF2804 domain-containing protein [Thalassotalea sp. ND16A]KGJ88115.1 hypothetical protein ND16A_2668 [Thalassotalea sp. ND16A]
MEANTERLPFCLINSDGMPKFGQFDHPIENLALNQFRYFGSMDKPAGKLSKHFHYKQFQFVSINTAQYIIGIAIADIRYLANGFIYIYDIASNTIIEQSWLRPPGIGYSTCASPSNGTASIGTAANNIGFIIQNGQWQLRLNTHHVQADICLTPLTNSLPLAMCSPTGYNGWTYTQKHNGLRVTGKLSVNQKTINLNQALAGYDFSAGYMRRETSWRWASINTQTDIGIIGLNLAAGVNETGDSENVLWLNGKRHYLPTVQFDFKRQRSSTLNTQPWHIRSAANSGQTAKVDLNFTPLNSRQERLNLWLLKSNFRQYLGHYNGVIIDSDGNEIMFNNILGLSEDHFARW